MNSEPMDTPLILVVDDDPIMREVSRVHLEQAGYAVAMAAGGEEGVEKAFGLEPAAVILDFAMPGVSGQDALVRIRANAATAALPVVMLTAWSSDENRQTAADLGAVWVEKPISGEVLVQTVQRLLSGSLLSDL